MFFRALARGSGSLTETLVFWQGREWTSKQWRTYQDALKRSEPQWEESSKEIIGRNPIPPIKIGDKVWDEWEPKLNK